MNGYKRLHKSIYLYWNVLFFLKNPGGHKKIQWFQKTFLGEEDELEKGQKKFYQLLRTRFRKIQNLPKGFEKTIFKLFFLVEKVLGW